MLPLKQVHPSHVLSDALPILIPPLTQVQVLRQAAQGAFRKGVRHCLRTVRNMHSGCASKACYSFALASCCCSRLVPSNVQCRSMLRCRAEESRSSSAVCASGCVHGAAGCAQGLVQGCASPSAQEYLHSAAVPQASGQNRHSWQSFCCHCYWQPW